MEWLTGYMKEVWHLLMEASFYVLIGMVIAGIIHTFMRTETIQKYLARGRIKSVLYSATLGVPLPLCSCGVIPAAVQLKKGGANKGAVTAFVISTPETGVDSITLTYGLMGPLFAVIRPLAALVTAIIAGLIENLIEKDESQFSGDPSSVLEGVTCSRGCCGGGETKGLSLTKRIRSGFSYAFGELMDDIAPSFTLGILIAGLISYLIPVTLIERYLSGGLFSMVLMMIVSLPLYVCASSSTPIAAAFIAKGMSPGTALVFLLAGPASNIASALVIRKFLGNRATGIYLVTIAVMSILFGLGTDWLYGHLGINPMEMINEGSQMIPHGAHLISTFIFVLLLARGLGKWFLNKKDFQ